MLRAFSEDGQAGARAGGTITVLDAIDHLRNL